MPPRRIYLIGPGPGEDRRDRSVWTSYRFRNADKAKSTAAVSAVNARAEEAGGDGDRR
jgi:hypothetical protein